MSEAISRERIKNRWLMLLVLVLIALLVAVSYQAQQRRQESRLLLNLTENVYQKGFHDLAQNMSEITGQLAQVLASASREQLSLSLSALWRQTFAAQANLGSLPLIMVPLNQTEKFLADTADGVYYALWRTARESDTLTEEEQQYIAALYERSRVLSESLDEISRKIVEEDLRLVDLQSGLWSGEGIEDNSILDGLSMLETELEDYPETNLNTDLSELAGGEETKGPPDALKEMGGDEGGGAAENETAGEGEVTPEITAEEAVDVALDFWLGQNPAGFTGRVAFESVGDLPSYSVEIRPRAGGDPIAEVDVTKKDGKVLWAMAIPGGRGADPGSGNGAAGGLGDTGAGTDAGAGGPGPAGANSGNTATPGAAGQTNQSGSVARTDSDAARLAMGARKAQTFLEDRDFPEMALTYSQSDGTYGIYTFVPLQEGVRLYADQLKIQVELVSQNITGYEGTPFYRNHRERKLPEVKVTRNQITTRLSPYLKVSEYNLALIEDDWGREIMAWEVRASFGQENFALYYNTQTGAEEKILRLQGQ